MSTRQRCLPFLVLLGGLLARRRRIPADFRRPRVLQLNDGLLRERHSALRRSRGLRAQREIGGWPRLYVNRIGRVWSQPGRCKFQVSDSDDP